MIKGQRLRVTCDQLNCERTRDASRQSANDWLDAQLALAAQQAIPDEKLEALADLDRKISWAANNRPEELAGLKSAREQLEASPPADLPLDAGGSVTEGLAVAKLFGIDTPKDLDPSIAQHFFGKRKVWQDRLANEAKVAKAKTVGANLEAFLELERQRVKPQTYREVRLYLQRLTTNDVLPGEMAVAKIDSDTVTAHYLWLAKQKWGNPQKNKYLGFFRRFVHWLYSVDRLEKEPKNLKARSQRFKVVAKPIKTFAAVKAVIDALPTSPYNCRLWALLGLNCGMTNADLGRLTWDMINLKHQTLTRRRVKTEAVTKAPTVTYRLWPETVEQLKAAGKGKGLVFTTLKNGAQMYETSYDAEGIERKKDLFSTYWSRLEKQPAITLGKFRSIGATTLKEKKEFRGYVEYYLGEVPSTIADIHYSAEADEPFFEALAFIRERLFEIAKVKQKNKH